MVSWIEARRILAAPSPRKAPAGREAPAGRAAGGMRARWRSGGPGVGLYYVLGRFRTPGRCDRAGRAGITPLPSGPRQGQSLRERTRTAAREGAPPPRKDRRGPAVRGGHRHHRQRQGPLAAPGADRPGAEERTLLPLRGGRLPERKRNPVRGGRQEGQEQGGDAGAGPEAPEDGRGAAVG